MNYINTDIYEVKREVINFSNVIGEELSKPKKKFIADMMYGFSASQSVLMSEVARSLMEPIKLQYTIERLCDNLQNLSEEDKDKINKQYHERILKHLDEDVVIHLDDSEVTKPDGKKFEDICYVRDASAKKETITPGYHHCEAIMVTQKKGQPISLYSHIYSSISNGFESKNTETIKSIDEVNRILKRQCLFVCDRGYDANMFFEKFLEDEQDFLIRLKSNRKLSFKGRIKKAEDLVKARKGKVKMSLWFQKETKETYISHTRVELPQFKGITLYLVMVYGLSDEHPMMLLTNRQIKSKQDVHKIVRAYFSRWRIEEYFHFKKEVYGFENYRVRSLKAMNTLNFLLNLHIGSIGLLAENLDTKLLGIKIIVRSQSLKKKVNMWYYQIARGIKKILSYAQVGIRKYHRIEKRKEFQQMRMNL